jgi:hypothetical protein
MQIYKIVIQIALIEPIACEERATKGKSRKKETDKAQAIRYKKP